MLSCKQARKDMVRWLANELAADQREAMRQHLDHCPGCSQAMKDLEGVWRQLEVLPQYRPPTDMRRRVLQFARWAADTDAAMQMQPQSRRLRWATGLPWVLGLLATLASGYILSVRVDLSQLPPLSLTISGALWMAFYAILFFLFFRGIENARFEWRTLARTALVAAGVFWLLTFASPVPQSLQLCSAYDLTQPLMDRLSIAMRYFVFGGLYALVPMALAGVISARHYPAMRPWVHGSLAGVSFAILLVPSIYLHCAPFAAGVLLGWFLGALVGSVVGGVLGYWLRCKWA